MLMKKVAALRLWVVSAFVAMLSVFLAPSTAFAQAADYGTLAAAGAANIQGDFDQVFAAAIPVMLVIVGAMVAWKYGKKLFSKV